METPTMDKNLLPVERLELFWKLYALIEAESAVLTCWRDIFAFCEYRDINLVPDEELVAWSHVARQAIEVLVWLGRLDWDGYAWPADCERRWTEKLNKVMAIHLNDLTAIKSGDRAR
jgi:hypothetical protein